MNYILFLIHQWYYISLNPFISMVCKYVEFIATPQAKEHLWLLGPARVLMISINLRFFKLFDERE